MTIEERVREIEVASAQRSFMSTHSWADWLRLWCGNSDIKIAFGLLHAIFLSVPINEAHFCVRFLVKVFSLQSKDGFIPICQNWRHIRQKAWNVFLSDFLKETTLGGRGWKEMFVDHSDLVPLILESLMPDMRDPLGSLPDEKKTNSNTIILTFLERCQEVLSGDPMPRNFRIHAVLMRHRILLLRLFIEYGLSEYCEVRPDQFWHGLGLNYEAEMRANLEALKTIVFEANDRGSAYSHLSEALSEPHPWRRYRHRAALLYVSQGAAYHALKKEADNADRKDSI